MAGEAVLSAFMQVLFEKLAVAALDEYKSLRNTKKELRSLRNTLSSIQDLLEDAENKQVKEKQVRRWLMKLKDVAYDIDDLLDEHTVVTPHLQVTRHLLTCYFCVNKALLASKIAYKIKGMKKKLEKYL